MSDPYVEFCFKLPIEIRPLIVLHSLKHIINFELHFQKFLDVFPYCNQFFYCDLVSRGPSDDQKLGPVILLRSPYFPPGFEPDVTNIANFSLLLQKYIRKFDYQLISETEFSTNQLISNAQEVVNVRFGERTRLKIPESLKPKISEVSCFILDEHAALLQILNTLEGCKLSALKKLTISYGKFELVQLCDLDEICKKYRNVQVLINRLNGNSPVDETLLEKLKALGFRISLGDCEGPLSVSSIKAINEFQSVSRIELCDPGDLQLLSIIETKLLSLAFNYEGAIQNYSFPISDTIIELDFRCGSFTGDFSGLFNLIAAVITIEDESDMKTINSIPDSVSFLWLFLPRAEELDYFKVTDFRIPENLESVWIEGPVEIHSNSRSDIIKFFNAFKKHN